MGNHYFEYFSSLSLYMYVCIYILLFILCFYLFICFCMYLLVCLSLFLSCFRDIKFYNCFLIDIFFSFFFYIYKIYVQNFLPLFNIHFIKFINFRSRLLYTILVQFYRFTLNSVKRATIFVMV